MIKGHNLIMSQRQRNTDAGVGPGYQKDGITGEFRRNAPECGGFADALSESLKQNRLSELKIPVKRFA
jgi:hypothetical protein